LPIHPYSVSPAPLNAYAVQARPAGPRYERLAPAPEPTVLVLGPLPVAG